MEYDIIIVGAGPAGISTALHLMKISPELAKRTLVLESQHHPRPKLCAGGVLQDGKYILKRLGLDMAEVPRLNASEAHFLFKGRGFCIKRHPESFYIVRREEFDSWLVQKARNKGIIVQEDTKVLNILPTSDGMKVITDKGECDARAVVGADGSNSIVRRSLIGKDNSASSMALEMHLHNEPSGKIDFKNEDCAYFDFSYIVDDLQGYIWDFPLRSQGKNARNRGIFCARVVRTQRALPNLKNMLRTALTAESIKLDKYQLKGHPIRSFDPKTRFSVNRAIFTGDAAGVDPIYGEGISFALGYGELAAQELKEAFDKAEFPFSGYRKRILNHPMGKCLRLRLITAKILYYFRKPWIQKFFWWRLGFLLKWYIESFLIDWAKRES